MKITGTDLRIRVLLSNSEDPGGAAGWSIADGSSYTATHSFQMAVYGYEVPALSSAVVSSATVADRHVTVNFTGNRGGCPVLRAWTVKVNGVGYEPTSGYCKSRSVELWLPEFSTPQIFGGMTVTVGYDKDAADLSFGTDVFGTKLTVGGNEVASFSDQPVTNLAPHPTGATVNGKTLTITFDQALDEDSVPPGSAFRVSTFHGGGPTANPCRGWCRPTVTAVALSGTTATLTLDQSIPSHAEASVSFLGAYGANRLQSASGHPRKSRFYVRATVLTADTPPVLQRATIGHHPPRPEDRLPAWRDVDLGPDESWLALSFNEVMDGSSLPPGSAFRVTARPRSGGRAVTVAGTGALKFQGDSVVVTLAQAVERDAVVTATYVKPSANALQDRTGSLLESFSDIPANNGTPGILSVALVSDAGPDRTYGRGEKIQMHVTFSGPMEVTGTPRLRIILGRTGQQPGEGRWVPYESGSGTATLTFAYTVKAGDSTAGNQGIAVKANSLQLNGGSVRSMSSTPIYAADLSHPGLPYNANHKVDGSLLSFQNAAVDGKTLTVTFNGDLNTASVPAPGVFRVTVNGARRNVASGGVAIDGATVTLTLASAVTPGDAVRLRYTRPSARRLQGLSGNAVVAFADRAVTNNTPVGLWSATLTVKDVLGVQLGCADGAANSRCSTALTATTFVYGGETYRVTDVSFQRGGQTSGTFSVTLDKAWPQVLRDNAVLHVGSVLFSLSDATFASDGTFARWGTGGSISGYSEGANVALRLTTVGSSGAGGNSGGEPASVTGVSVVSSAGADKTYGDGDRIEVRATFEAPV
ncbi:MAG: SwmB domain-containing protein, partial [Rhodospirillales bacterium]|nr:SwmB domain-containing protein [Rhodospirillales bacterium]